MRDDAADIKRRLEALVSEGEKFLETVPVNRILLSDRESGIAQEWGIKSLNALEDIFGNRRRFLDRFQDHCPIHSHSKALQALGVLKAAKSDYEDGYSSKMRTVIQAEVFSDFLEQAEYLFGKGYYQPAAVIVGGVLEDSLRKLCDLNSIVFPKSPTIEPMNVELARQKVYGQFVKDKVSSLGKLRNHAAHGEWDKFAEKDVEDMIHDVRRFMEEYFV